MTKVRVYRLARLEVVEATRHYDSISTELGDGLVEEFQRALRQLSEFPLSVPILRGDIRKRPLFRFPYNIFYRVRAKEVQILALVHQRRGPKHVTKRLSRITEEVREG